MQNAIPHQITLAQAIDLTTRFRQNPGTDMPLSEAYAADSVRLLLQQPGCATFRIYYGRKEDDSICSVLVGVDIAGNDILPTQTGILATAAGDDDGIILEDALHCPPVCPEPSPLNG